MRRETLDVDTTHWKKLSKLACFLVKFGWEKVFCLSDTLTWEVRVEYEIFIFYASRNNLERDGTIIDFADGPDNKAHRGIALIVSLSRDTAMLPLKWLGIVDTEMYGCAWGL